METCGCKSCRKKTPQEQRRRSARLKKLKKLKKQKSRKRQRSRKKAADGVGLKQIATALGVATVAGSVLSTPLPSVSVQSISVPSPMTTTTSFSTPSFEKQVRNNSSEFLKMYKRSDNTRQDVKNKINAVPKGFENKDKDKDFLSWNTM